MKGFLSTLILISSISLATIILTSDTAISKDKSGDEAEISLTRRIVESVVFDGVSSFPKSDVQHLLYTKPNRWYNFLKKRRLSKTSVNIDISTIKRFYGRHGYLFAAVDAAILNRSRNRAVVVFHVTEGRKTFLTGVGLSGGLDDINQKFNRDLSKINTAVPIDAEEITSGGFKLRDFYNNNGYPYAKITSELNYNIDSTQVNVSYVVAESLLTFNDSTQIANKGKTRPHVLIREIVAKPGKKYSQKDLVDSEQHLYSTGLFKFVSLKRDDSSLVVANDTAHVGFKLGVDERKQYYVNFGLGLGNQTDFPLVLSGYGQWGIRNIAGTGRGVVLGIHPYFQMAGHNGQLAALNFSDLKHELKFDIIRSTFELDYSTPWLSKFRIPLTAKFIYEPYTLNPNKVSLPDTIYHLPDSLYRYDRVAVEAVFLRELSRFTSLRLTADIEYINIRNVPPEFEAAFRTLGDNSIRRSLLFYGSRDTRDNIFVPQKGSYSFVGLDFVGGILGGDFSYIRGQASWSRYQILTGQNVIASRLWMGWLDDFFKGGISARDDRFIIGGSTTIRGYTQEMLTPKFTEGDLAGTVEGGRYLMVGNLEIRRPLFWRFGGSVFLDGGRTYSHLGDITAASLRFSTGMGIQFFTPVGPIRVDYAVRLKKQFDLSAGLFHLAILYAF
jgi:outer membrane protein insertion porin family